MWQASVLALMFVVWVVPSSWADAPTDVESESAVPAAKAEKSVAELCSQRDAAADEREAQRADAELQKRGAQDQCRLTQLEATADQTEAASTPKPAEADSTVLPEQNPRGADARDTANYEARGWAALPRGSTRSDQFVYVSKAEAAKTDTPYGWVPGSMTSDQGPRAVKRTRNGQMMSSNHQGRDYNVGGGVKDARTGQVKYPEGEGVPVKASADGKVVSVGNKGGYGVTVVVDHGDGTTSQYSHLQEGSVTVKPGQVVGEGYQLARVGQTGNSTAPHLHYEERVNNKPARLAGNTAGIRNYGAGNNFWVADAGVGTGAGGGAGNGGGERPRAPVQTVTVRNESVMSLARQSLSNPFVQQLMGNGAGLFQTGQSNLSGQTVPQGGGLLASLFGFDNGGAATADGDDAGQSGMATVRDGQPAVNQTPTVRGDVYALDLFRAGRLEQEIATETKAWHCEHQVVTAANEDLLTDECVAGLSLETN